MPACSRETVFVFCLDLGSVTDTDHALGRPLLVPAPQRCLPPWSVLARQRIARRLTSVAGLEARDRATVILAHFWVESWDFWFSGFVRLRMLRDAPYT